MGDVIADLRLPRDGYCVSSKVYFGAVDNPGPTQRGLSRKHVPRPATRRCGVCGWTIWTFISAIGPTRIRRSRKPWARWMP